MRSLYTIGQAGALLVAGISALSFGACAKSNDDVFSGAGGDGGTWGVSNSSGSVQSAVSSSSSSTGVGGQGGQGGQSGTGGCGNGAGGTACVDGQMQVCYTGPPASKNKGICKDGVQTCTCAEWGTCIGEVLPAMEACDNIDNDCNGIADNGLGGTTCNTNMPGLCSLGTMTCSMGSFTCTPVVLPVAEICDAQDNDCDGQTDEGTLCPSNEQCVQGFCMMP